MPTYNPAYSGKNPRINGSWGSGVTSKNTNVNFIDNTAFIQTPAYIFGNTPRTAPYNLSVPATMTWISACAAALPCISPKPAGSACRPTCTTSPITRSSTASGPRSAVRTSVRSADRATSPAMCSSQAASSSRGVLICCRHRNDGGSFLCIKKGVAVKAAP